jgi:lysophospholipase L1-like esterase
MRRPFRTLLCLAATAAGLTFLSAPANAAGANYVALGDSYSSGLGTGGPYSGGGCQRSSSAYPQLWANTHAPASFGFAACAGATTSDVLSGQVGSLSASTTLVTISIGGNDAGFTDVITTCTLGSDSTCVNRVNQAKTFVGNELPARLDNVYAQIKQRSPAARVILRSRSVRHETIGHQQRCRRAGIGDRGAGRRGRFHLCRHPHHLDEPRDLLG